MAHGGPIGGFAHLVNVTDVAVSLPYEIAPKHRLVRATIEQARRVREQLARTPAPWMKPGPVYPYELSVVPGEGGVVTHTPLPEDHWRYFVIEFDGDNAGLNGLEVAEDVLGGRMFEVGLTFINVESFGWCTSHGIRPTPSDVPIGGRAPLRLTVTEPDLTALRTVHEQLEKHDHNIYDLKGVLRELYELRMVDPRARLRFLAYFAVLESVLTHKPQPEDRYDSITRQVKTKMRLVSNRRDFKWAYVEQFGATPEDTVWEKLYAYRSAIAHGGSTLITPGGDQTIVGKLAVLKSHDNALSFLVKATSCVLRFALEEPKLLRDLHEC